MKMYVEEPLHDFIAIARITIRALQPHYNECENDALLDYELPVFEHFGLASPEIANCDLLDWTMTDKLRSDLKDERRHEWDPCPHLVANKSAPVHDLNTYLSLLDHTVSINYNFLTKFTHSVWQQVKEGDLIRVLTADGRRT